ncbi:MAG: hydantoinase/oxoprolinase family protein [Ectothiorhodospiraceae bacterium]|nr:hydantoinase/oxoprolinase family protein [Ectothiorhodospiraceae bacterium]
MTDQSPPSPEVAPPYRLGVDIGGTFTDFCLLDVRSGELRSLKVLSTPQRPGEEIATGLRALEARHGVAPSEIAYFVHGTTVGVNTVLQRKGARLWLLTTEAFEDVLEVARLKMPDPYDLFSRRPAPLVPRERVAGVRERIAADGTVEVPIDEASVLAALGRARDDGADGVVVSFLHAYRNPVHEQAVRALAERVAPELDVVCSSEVWPVIREYERTVTATIAAYVRTRVADYLGSLERSLVEAGVSAAPMITKSNGGIMTVGQGKRECAQMLLSGTASGVMGASWVARQTGAEAVMSLDVGGTSADVALVVDGEPRHGVGELIGDFPLYLPTVSVSSIGEGGGSIAWVDSHGVLNVGPESAGSSPGPACYGLGGERPTITDAFVVCGFLGDSLGYGAVTLDPERAFRAVESVARALGKGVRETAEAIIRVAVSGMYLEVSKLLSRAGLDPRAMELQAFGGAGPMIAGFLARELAMARVVVPRTPGVLSAFGGLVADLKNDFVRTVYRDLEADAVGELRAVVDELAARGVAWLREEAGFAGEPVLECSADMRYRGQSFEIETPLELAWLRDGDLGRIAAAFHDEHRRLYEHADPQAAVQVVNLRLVARGVTPKPPLEHAPPGDRPPRPHAARTVWLDGTEQRALVHHRAALGAGSAIEGPAVVEQEDCTTVVLGGHRAVVDTFGNLVISRIAPPVAAGE